MREITIGTAHTSTLKVGEGDTAVALGSGDLRVLGTPAMTALMENAAMSAIAPLLDETESSVGISLNITHDRATGIGDSVSATAVVTAVEGRLRDQRFRFVGNTDRGRYARPFPRERRKIYEQNRKIIVNLEKEIPRKRQTLLTKYQR